MQYVVLVNEYKSTDYYTMWNELTSTGRIFYNFYVIGLHFKL